MKKYKQKELLKMCYSKRRYKTNEEANLAGLYQIKQKGTASGLYFYLCPNCNTWHLTHHKTKNRVV